MTRSIVQSWGLGRRWRVAAATAAAAAFSCTALVTMVGADAAPQHGITVRVTGPAAGLVDRKLAFLLATTMRGGDRVKVYSVSFGHQKHPRQHRGRPPKTLHHTFTHTGVFAVTVLVRDAHGKTATSTHHLTVDPPTGRFNFYQYASRIPKSYQAGPFIDERGKPNNGDHVTPLTRFTVYDGLPGFVGPEHTSDGGVKPDIFVNRKKAFTDSAGVTIPAHSILAHPGMTPKYSPIVRFSNPAGRTKKYTATATITSLDGGGGDGVAGFLYQTAGGKIVQAASNDGAVSIAPPAGSTPTQTLEISGTLPAHGSIYVVVGNNGTYNYDSAEIGFTVTLR